MASAVQHSNILKAELDISTKLSNLEERAANLESEFSQMMQSAKELAKIMKCYVDKTETETRSWTILESIMEGDNKVRDVLDHVKIFFNFLLAKMASKHAEITDIKMLWHLLDKEGVKEVFNDAIKSFGFNGSDESDIKLLLAVTYKLQVDMERDVIAAEDKTYTNNHDVNHNGETLDAEKTNVHEQNKKQSSTDTADENVIAKSDKDIECVKDKLKVTGLDAKANISIAKTSDFDHTSVTTDVSDKASAAVLAWNVEDSLKNVARRMVAIVIQTLNVGRDEKDLAITAENKEHSNTA